MRFSTSLSVLLVLLTVSATPAAMAEDGWVRIDAPVQFRDHHGVLRKPRCSGGPKLVDTLLGTAPVKADTDYAFFIRHGDPKRLAILWDGGGACWDANTCVASGLLGTPVYSLEVDETVEGLAMTEGIGDIGNRDNPIAGYTQVFIPYCSADLHTGANDQLYTLTLPGGKVVPWLIHHRGYDNVAYVLDWLTHYYQNEVGGPPMDVFLAGASAGGYGVLYSYPAVAELLPWYTRVRLLVDAANGVITQDFYDRALAPGGVWRVWENLSPVLTAAFAAGPDEIGIEIFKSLGNTYPRARFGQYTTAFDTTQIFYFNVARNVGSLVSWFDPLQLAAAGFEWTLRSRYYMILTALQTWNYRFYLGRGDDHTVVADDKFYLEDSAQGVALVDWLDDMINRLWPWGSDWRNVACTPDCLP